MKRLFHILLFLLLTLTVSAQEEYLWGRDFWTFSIKEHNESPWQDSVILYIYGDTACTGYVENPNTGLYQTFTVTPGHVLKLKIHPNHIVCDDIFSLPPNVDFVDSFSLKAVHLVTTRNVLIYRCAPSGLHPIKQSVFPTQMFRTYAYFQRMGYAWPSGIRLVVVATEDSTEISEWRNGIPVLQHSLRKGEILIRASSSGEYCRYNSFMFQTNCKTIKRFVHHGGELYRYHFYGGFRNVQDNLHKAYANRRLYKRPMFSALIYYTSLYTGHMTVPWLGRNVFDSHSTTLPNTIDNIFGSEQFSVPILNDNFELHYLGFNPIYTQSGPYINNWDLSIVSDLNNSPPTNYFVRSCWIPTSTNEMPDDTNYADLLIYVHEDGLNSTTLNGQPIPASAFDSFPYTNREYWVAQFAYYNQDIPPYFKIENPHGFHADLDEIAYHARPSDPSKIDVTGFLLSSSGEAYEDLDFAHSNLSPHDSATVWRCVGDTLHLDANTQWDSIPCLWTFDGTDYPDRPMVDLPLLDTGRHVARLVLYGNPNCPDTTTTFVQVLPPPVIRFSSDTILCRGAELSAEDPNAILYRWSTGATTPSVTIDTAGFYSVTVTNRGCSAHADSVLVDLFPSSAVDLGADTALCGTVSLLLDAGQPHPASYLWQDGSTNRTYTVIDDGTYWVVVTDNCTGVSDTIAVEYLEDFDIELGNDTTLCTGAELRLSAYTPGADYRWQDGSTQAEYVVRHAGEYSVEVSNRCFSHGDRIYVAFGDCSQEVRLPTAFTPDGDGLNDRLLPVFEHPEQVQDFRMEVFDRWGGVLFVTGSLTEGWDGGNAPMGVYVVRVRHTDPDGTEHIVRAAVTLVR